MTAEIFRLAMSWLNLDRRTGESGDKTSIFAAEGGFTVLRFSIDSSRKMLPDTIKVLAASLRLLPLNKQNRLSFTLDELMKQSYDWVL